MQYVSTYFSPNKGAANILIGFIDKCEKTIDVAVYCITHDEICDSLIAAHKRGVKVRVITDSTQAAGKYSDDEKIKDAGISLIVGGKAWRSSMHNKFIIGDASAIGTGSFNWSKNADKSNDENFVIIRLSYVVKEFKKEFDNLWKKYFIDS